MRHLRSFGPTFALAAAALTLASQRARADAPPYVVIRDDGALEALQYRTGADLEPAQAAFIGAYRATGLPLPEVMSVWTTFPMDGSTVQTLFVPLGVEARGVGLEQHFGPFLPRTPEPPLQAILLHNDVTALEARAAVQHADDPLAHAEYLFLLELSHLVGPAVRIDGAPDTLLAAWPFHWSFYLNHRSPAGGTPWRDRGDGTFATEPHRPGAVEFSPLDLYLLGLAPPEDVPPFEVLENVEVISSSTDPFSGRGVNAMTFPWFGDEPVVVRATARRVTIDEVVAREGARLPAFGEAPTERSVAFVLVVGRDDDVASAEALFAPVAARLAPAYARATGGRGTLGVIARAPGEPTDGGPNDAVDGGTGDAHDGAMADAMSPRRDDGGVTIAPAPPHSGGGCRVDGGRAGTSSLVLAALVGLCRRRRRPSPYRR